MHKMLLSHDLLPFLAQQTPAPTGPFGMTPGMFQIVFFGLLMAAMWFLMIAPQRKKQKEHQKMLSELKAGDEILTSGGIYGTVVNVKESRIVVRIGDNNTKIELAKGFVQTVERKRDAEKKAE
jgi:preprotein translocase subunit YajC